MNLILFQNNIHKKKIIIIKQTKAYPSGRLFFSSGRANTHRARTSALRAESGGSTFSVAGLH
jgi:hypothetical protein